MFRESAQKLPFNNEPETKASTAASNDRFNIPRKIPEQFSARLKISFLEWPSLQTEFCGAAEITGIRGRPTIGEYLQTGDLSQPEVRKRAFDWLAEQVNAWVNVVRRRIRSVVADLHRDGH
jgi:hypothetical protein